VRVGLVWVQFYLIDLGLAPSVEEVLSKMMEAAERAVQLDPNDGEAHLPLGQAYGYQGKREQAAAEYAKAETLAPSNADLLLIAAWSIVQFGETDRAVSLAEQALKLNPHYPDWYNQGLSVVFFFGEQYDKSVQYRLLVRPLLSSGRICTSASAWPGVLTRGMSVMKRSSDAPRGPACAGLFFAWQDAWRHRRGVHLTPRRFRSVRPRHGRRCPRAP
jgi:tetratricopeptide (TPR) repeat protein